MGGSTLTSDPLPGMPRYYPCTAFASPCRARVTARQIIYLTRIIPISLLNRSEVPIALSRLAFTALVQSSYLIVIAQNKPKYPNGPTFPITQGRKGLTSFAQTGFVSSLPFFFVRDIRHPGSRERKEKPKRQYASRLGTTSRPPKKGNGE